MRLICLMRDHGRVGMKQGVSDFLFLREGVGETGAPGFGGNVGREMGVVEKRG